MLDLLPPLHPDPTTEALFRASNPERKINDKANMKLGSQKQLVRRS